MHWFAKSNSVCRVKVLAVVDDYVPRLVVGLTNNDPSITTPVYKDYYYKEFDSKYPAGISALMSFQTDDVYRYVIVQNRFKYINHLCLKEVKVYETGKAFCVIQNGNQDWNCRRMTPDISWRWSPVLPAGL